MINIKTKQAIVKYALKPLFTSFQNLYRNDAITNLANSKLVAIIITLVAAPANILPIPKIE